MDGQWNDDGHWNGGGPSNEGDQWNEHSYGSYAALDEQAMLDCAASPMERRASDQSTQSYWSHPSSGDLSWPASTPPDEGFPSEPNEGFLFPPGSPVQNYNYHQFPDTQDSSFVRPLDYAEGYQIPDVEAAARHATETAAYHLYRYRLYQCEELQTAFITSDDIDAIIQLELSHDNYPPTRQAVQTLLYRALCGRAPVPETDTILLEAAWHLQLRTEGPADEVSEICHKALVVTLIQLRGGGGSVPDSDPHPPTQAGPSTKTKKMSKPKTEKKRHVCRLAECSDEPRSFGRAADLDRHQDKVHHGGKRYPCDYKWCSRHAEPFSRQDHYRDHLRTAHYEDLPLRGPGKMDAAWWEQRSQASVAGGWWRCNRCLEMRVSIAEYDFVCPGCGAHCEADRIDYRRELEEGPMQGEGDGHENGY